MRASYQFEVVVSVRGCQWQMHRRFVSEHSVIFRQYDELLPQGPDGRRKPDRTKSPHQFSVFLDPNKSTQASKSVSFAFDLAVLVPDCEVDRKFLPDRHYEGGYIYRELILVEAFPDEASPSQWRVQYGFQGNTPNKAARRAEIRPLRGEKGIAFDIPVILMRFQDETKRGSFSAWQDHVGSIQTS